MNFKSALRSLRFNLVFPCLALLPARLGYWLATRIGTLDWRYLNRSERFEVEHQLSKIPVFARENIEKYSLNYSQMMARDMLDTYRMPKLAPESAANFISVEGLANLYAAQQKGRGVILLVPHYGRYFSIAPALRFAGHQFGVLTTVIDETTAPEPLWRNYLLMKVENARMFWGGAWITTADSPRRMYASLRAGQTLLISFDGLDSNSSEKLLYPCMGGQLSIPAGALRIAKSTGAALVYASAKECTTGLKFELHPLPSEPKLALDRAVRLLEQDIIEMPWHWWLWRALPRLWEKGGEVGFSKD